jgi:hypothetical protein
MMHGAMITTVATWACKCGVSIKAIGETDRDKPVMKVVATCPNCGNKQDIYAHRISSITCERIASPPTTCMPFSTCEEKLSLLLAYQRLGQGYSEAISKMTRGNISSADYQRLSIATEKARIASIAARDRLNRHIAEHGC